MPRQVRPEIEDQVILGVKDHLRQARRRDPVRVADLLERGLGRLGVVGVGAEPGEPEDRRAVARMAHAGKGQ